MALAFNFLYSPKLADSVAAVQQRHGGIERAEDKSQQETSSNTVQAEDSPLADESEAFDLVQSQAATQLEQMDSAPALPGNSAIEMPPECKAMWMQDNYRTTFVNALTRRKTKQYLEWGGGASTLCSARLAEQVTTIEHNQEWCKKLREQLREQNITNVNLVCAAVEWQHFGTWPGGDGSYEEFHDYVDTIDTLGIPHFDVVFIDGRARPACAKKVLGYISRDSVVMVHDFQREWYHTPVLQWYEALETFTDWPELGVLRQKL